jgi:hypothetical protein
MKTAVGVSLAAAAQKRTLYLQALALPAANRELPPTRTGTLERAAQFLAASEERRTMAYRPLWIGKSLYAPKNVVHSAVLSALALWERL